MTAPSLSESRFPSRQSVADISEKRESPAPGLPIADAPPDAASHRSFRAPKTDGEPELSRRFVGQAHAFSLLLTLAEQHRRTLEGPAGVSASRNLLLLGPPGTGKTTLPQLVCGQLNIPLIIVDACGFAPPGARMGRSLDEIFGEMMQAAAGRMRAAQQGALLIEGLDRLAQLTPPELALQLQQAWIQVLDGRSRPVATAQGTAMLSARGWWIIASGTFEGMERVIARRAGQPVMGFKPLEPLAHPPVPATADLTAFGLLPGLSARLPFVCELHPLSVDDLTTLSRLESSAVGQWVREFRRAGILLEFEDAARQELAESAFALGVGARGLEVVLSQRLGNLLVLLPQLRGRTQRIVVHAEALRGSEPPLIVTGTPLVPVQSINVTTDDGEGESLPAELAQLFPRGTLPVRPARAARSAQQRNRLATPEDLCEFLGKPA